MTRRDPALLQLAQDRKFDDLRRHFHDGDLESVFEVAEYLREEDLYQLAIELYEHLLPKEDSARIHFGVGQCYGKIYDYDTALRHLRRAFELEPDRESGTHYYAYILERRELMEEADRWYRKALEGRYGEDLWTLSHYACFLEKAGRGDEAHAAYEDVLERNPGYTWAVKRFAIFLLDRGDAERSLELMRGALDAFPDAPFVKLNYLEYLILREEADAYERYHRELEGQSPAPWFPVVVDLLDYFCRYLLKGSSDLERAAAFERAAQALTDSVHRDFDDLNRLLASKGGDLAEWSRLVGLLLK